MQYVWHEEKRQSNLKKHGLDFALVRHFFAGPTFTFEDTRLDYGEQRWVTIGLIKGDVVVVVHTESKDEIRIISMRKAVKHEQDLYFTNLYG